MAFGIIEKVIRPLLSLWQTLSKPAQYLSLGTIAIASFVMGIIFWGGFNTALEATNTEAFCISCHSMRDTVYPELQERFTGAITQGFVLPVPTAMCPITGPIRLPGKCRPPKKCGVLFSVRLIPRKNSKPSDLNWHPGSGPGSPRTSRWSARTATATTA